MKPAGKRHHGMRMSLKKKTDRKGLDVLFEALTVFMGGGVEKSASKEHVMFVCFVPALRQIPRKWARHGALGLIQN